MACLASVATAAHASSLAGEVIESRSPAISNRTPSPTISTAAAPSRTSVTASSTATHAGTVAGALVTGAASVARVILWVSIFAGLLVARDANGGTRRQVG